MYFHEKGLDGCRPWAPLSLPNLWPLHFYFLPHGLVMSDNFQLDIKISCQILNHKSLICQSLICQSLICQLSQSPQLKLPLLCHRLFLLNQTNPTFSIYRLILTTLVSFGFTQFVLPWSLIPTLIWKMYVMHLVRKRLKNHHPDASGLHLAPWLWQRWKKSTTYSLLSKIQQSFVWWIGITPAQEKCPFHDSIL